MTSDDHPTLDELAELAEGGLSPEREPAVRTHLAGCAHCQAQTTALAQAQDALRSLGPTPMPPDVAIRIDAALAAERGAPSTGPTDAAADVVPDLTGIRNKRRRAGMPSAPTAAAATIVILAVVAIVIGVNHHSKSKTQDTAGVSAGAESLTPLVGQPPAGSGTGTATTFVIQATGRTYSTANLATLAPKLDAGTTVTTPTVPGATAPSGSTPSGSAAGGTSSSGGSSQAKPTNASSKRASHHPKKVLNVPTASGSSALGSVASTLPEALHKYVGDSDEARQAVLHCAAFISTTANAVPEAVDLGRWTNPTAKLKDVPALILLFAGPPGTNYNVVYVVGPNCGDNDVYQLQNVSRTS